MQGKIGLLNSRFRAVGILPLRLGSMPSAERPKAFLL